jgi:uncharacterized protein (UPF0248 family)
MINRRVFTPEGDAASDEMTGKNARDTSLKARWGEGLEGYIIAVDDRFSPSGRSEIPGRMVQSVGKAYMDLPKARIPYHRIIGIMRDDERIWSRAIKR